MLWVRTFKGYEDKVQELDNLLNAWIRDHNVDVVDIKASMSHEPGGRSGMGDLIYTVIYRADAPIAQ